MTEELKKRICRVDTLYFDLDGTLLTREKTISQHTADVLMRVVQKGYRIGFSTGRSLDTLGGMTRPVGLCTNGLSIGCAGAEVSSLRDGRVDRRYLLHPFDREDLRDLMRFVVEEGLHFSMDGTGDKYVLQGLSYLPKYRRDKRRAEENGAYYPEIVELLPEPADLERALDGTVIKPMVWFPEPSRRQVMEKWLGEHPGYSCLASGSTLVELLSADISKATALEAACALQGIDPSCCCVFGDSENDIPIMERAGVCVAMCNGFAETREIADIVTGKDNDADGVAETVEELFL